MATYYIAETQHLNSVRATDKIEAATLSEAKKYATKNQSFCGTILKIFDDEGYLIASRRDGQRKWVDYDPADQVAPKIAV